MEHQPLPDFDLEPALPAPREPHLELVPALEEDEAEEAEVALGEDEEVVEEVELDASPAPVQDPLKLYVRQIGDGPLLTRAEERELA
ncbi:MAG TPA: sigma-70 factor domain-containing protein, partial [Gaiellaceae bacterium]